MSYESPFPQRFEPEFIIVSDSEARFDRLLGRKLNKPYLISISEYMNMLEKSGKRISDFPTIHRETPPKTVNQATSTSPASESKSEDSTKGSESGGKKIGGAIAGAAVGALFGPLGILLGGLFGSMLADD